MAAVSAIRKGSRLRNLWPSRTLRMPPPASPPSDATIVEADLAGQDPQALPRGLTAHELIAMARTARARRSQS
ncbi:hypothetical protein [Methylorubrum zatmanii]|uniref:Uncharacterized protein n=1 Tax=Methylorubrum zatmanii TaxID=29429 RepID=A0ABW1WMG4_9HYPH|nr:hypothetical protein [Methylorubrum zatmanii]MBD8908667.1 hypothetical protein [Methylorubrum zatmanii]